ncbi:MAG: alpha/beta fold hydrolase [Chitinophagales bacterium]
MELHYKDTGAGFPVIVLHGLMGSLDNWQTVAKAWGANFKVYTIDQRNHGRSPWSDDFNYELLANDLLQFMDEQNISKAHLVGHSMGGKVAMQVALQHPERMAKLVVVDVAPVQYEDRHTYIFKALEAVPLEQLTSRQQAEDILRLRIRDNSTIQFLMKSLYRDDENHFRWRFNLAALHRNYAAISTGVSGGAPFTGSSLFVKGSLSDYVNAENYALIQQMFPNNELEEISGSGHWVHADNFPDFVASVNRFLLA